MKEAFTCIATEFDAFRNPIISFPSGSIRLKVTAAKLIKKNHIRSNVKNISTVIANYPSKENEL